MSVTVQVGYNHRTWVSFEIKDATPEEITTLARGDEEEAIALAAQMDEAGRLTRVEEERDECPEIFTSAVECSILDVTVSD